MNKRMDRSKFIIGTYHLRPYARTEKHIREMAECGIDYVCTMDDDREALDLFAKYGVGANVKNITPWWLNRFGPGQMEQINSFDQYVEAAKNYVDHPAIWAIDTGDEPSALDFPYFGKVIDFVENAFENQFAYLNLFPSYASVSQNTEDEAKSQLGTKSYAEHIARYCENVATDYICYDYYMYAASVAGAYENLRIVSEACRRTGRSMWIVLQVNSHDPNKFISENQLRFQAYSALSFGVESIIWACYTAGWWYNQVLDANGEKTQQYDKLKRVNHELRALGETYMKYRNVSTHFVGFAPDHKDLRELSQAPIPSLSTGVFFDLHAQEGTPLVVGQMVSREGDGSYALMICAADDPWDTDNKTSEVVFRTRRSAVTLYQGDTVRELIPDENGICRFTLASSAGALVVAR